MRQGLRKFTDKFVESLLMLSGAITSITVLLIVLFLFSEGIGVFNEKPMNEGYSLVVSKANPVSELQAEEVKDVFDQKISNWKKIGGKDLPILLFKIDDISNYYTDEQLGKELENVPACINDFMLRNEGAIAFLSDSYLPKKFTGKKLDIDKVKVGAFFTGDQWFPTASPVAQLGVKPLIMGTLWVSLGAILLALPIGLAAAIYLSEIANFRVRNVLKPLIELLAGIPSVVYGFFGLVVIVPLIQQTFDLPVGETGLAGSIVLGIMALPTIITISEDAMRNTPRAMKEASLALGASKWQTIYKIVIPYSASGITAGAILGIGRAIGETMAVLMVTGNASVMPNTLLEPLRTIPATIAAELGEAPNGGVHYKALFALGCILFLITLVINLTVEYVINRKKTTSH